MTASHTHPSPLTPLQFIAPLAAMSLLSSCALADAGIGAISGSDSSDMGVLPDGMETPPPNKMTEPVITEECDDIGQGCEQGESCVQLAYNDAAEFTRVCIDLFALPNMVNYEAPSSDSYATFDESSSTLHLVQFPDDIAAPMAGKFRSHHIRIESRDVKNQTYDFPNAMNSDDILLTSLSALGSRLYLGLNQNVNTTEGKRQSSFLYSFSPMSMDLEVLSDVTYSASLIDDDPDPPKDYAQDFFLIPNKSAPKSALVKWTGRDTLFTSGYFCSSDDQVTGCTHAGMFRDVNDASLTSFQAEDGFVQRERENVSTLDIETSEDHIATLTIPDQKPPQSMLVYFYTEDDDEPLSVGPSVSDPSSMECPGAVNQFHYDDEESTARVLKSDVSSGDKLISFIAIAGTQEDSSSHLYFYRSARSGGGLISTISCKSFRNISRLRLLDNQDDPDFDLISPEFKTVLAGSKESIETSDTLIVYNAGAALNQETDKERNTYNAIQIIPTPVGTNKLQILEAFAQDGMNGQSYVILAKNDNDRLFMFRVDTKGEFLPL